MAQYIIDWGLQSLVTRRESNLIDTFEKDLFFLSSFLEENSVQEDPFFALKKLQKWIFPKLQDLMLLLNLHTEYYALASMFCFLKTLQEIRWVVYPNEINQFEESMEKSGNGRYAAFVKEYVKPPRGAFSVRNLGLGNRLVLDNKKITIHQQNEI